MASTSSSTLPCKYDVFISFRGKDTRYNILSHLSKALEDKQINVFTDEELRKGKEISPELLKIIRESSISIIIFSENYADSPWCLDELVEIRKCKEESGQIVLPVFYHVDPTDVQELTGNFGKAFDIAERGERGSLQKVGKWRRALMEISNLSGWDSQNIKYESTLIEEIVNDVLKKIIHMSSSDNSYDRSLVGIELRVKKVEQLLNDKTIVGIWGMGGIGKTTIAQEVFRRNRSKFDAHCFVENVRETMIKQSPNDVRDKIIRQLLREKKLLEDTLFWGPFIRRMLKSKKIFIVFDDVDDANHLKNLVGECDLCGVENRIIVTSRDQQVLKNFGPKESICEVEKLTYPEDLELFSLHAFKQNHPKEGYIELSKKAITYAGGNPLALKVLGSHLFDMGIEEWQSELEKLKGQSLKKIQDVLKISYDGLEKNEKEIFLHIACFFKWHNKDEVEGILEACGLFPKSAITRLINKSLINISCNVVDMHDLIEKMGKDIVSEECKQLGRRSRLWNYKDVHHVLTTNTGTENVESILLDMRGTDSLELSSTALMMKMCNLRFFKVISNYNGRVLLPHYFEFPSQELRCLYWHYYPLTSLPSNFCPKNLVVLDLQRSNLIELWNGDQPLGNLKIIRLSDSKDLIRIPDLSSTAPNLELLDLSECESLVEIPSSFQNLSKLTELNLFRCYNVRYCPEIPCNIGTVLLSESGIEHLPSSIEHLTQLFRLSLHQCTRLVSIPNSIGELKCLKEFALNGCSNLTSLPESMKQLSKLKWLDLRGCKRLKCLPELPSCLEVLDASECTSLESASTSFLFIEHEDENEEADESEDEDHFKDCKRLFFGKCVNLDKKVMEDVFEAHMLHQEVSLYMAGGEVPERMRYKNRRGSWLSFRLDLRHLIAFSFCAVISTSNYFDLWTPMKCRVDFIDESGHTRSQNFIFYKSKDQQYMFKYPSEHVLLWFSYHSFIYVNKECFVEASLHFSTDDDEGIIKCGVHPIYMCDSLRRNKKRRRNEEHPQQHQDDEEHQPPLQRKKRRLLHSPSLQV
ncbi:disease resistance protein RPV1 [Hevea brasiliensis]|uniref:disease resistance protein RPV1 n=1 Tax=Hevea brasiliensis TaxID=3981 RepID=UPI0025F31F1E|nr:disease resistance protein RPV1 [Hevea brasiliensis]